MHTGDIFEKTAKGIEEIEKRTCRIDFRHRIALIQVDGKHAVEVLLAKIPGDGFASLEELWRDGFIAPIGKPAASTGAPPGAANITTAVSAAFNLDDAKRHAAGKIESLLGPEGDALAVAIERVKTFAEFVARAERTRDIIGQMRGAARAKEFWSATGL